MKLADLTAGYVEKVDAATPWRRPLAGWCRGVGSLLITREGRVRASSRHDLPGRRLTASTRRGDGGRLDVRLPHVATPDWTIERAADVMVEYDIRHLPLVDDDGNVAGVVSIKDVLWALRGPTVT